MLTKKEKKARIEDIKNVLLPELIPDQLQLLGITDFDGKGDEFNHARLNPAQGIELIKLLTKRVEKVTRGGGLYKDRETATQCSQLSYVTESLSRFMQQATFLNDCYPSEDQSNAILYSIIDRLTFLALTAGYFAGNNDALALTDRYVNYDYREKVTKPQSGGKAKSAKADPLRKLVNDMGKVIISDPTLGKIIKAVLARSIHNVITQFSNKGDNKSIPALVQFIERHPTSETINNWLRNLKIDKNNNNLPVSEDKIIQVLHEKFSENTIAQYLNKAN